MPEKTMRRKEKGQPRANELEAVTIVRARDILGELANQAGYGNKRIPLTRRGHEIAALIGLTDLDRLRKLDGAA